MEMDDDKEINFNMSPTMTSIPLPVRKFLANIHKIKTWSCKDWCSTYTPWKQYDKVFLNFLDEIKWGMEVYDAADEYAQYYFDDPNITLIEGIMKSSKYYNLMKILNANEDN